MKIIESGHIYQLDEVNTNDTNGSTIIRQEPQIIYYVNNEGPKFYNGIQSQELLRVLIDRTMHCDNCLRWPTNDKIIFHLRMALILHEARALERKVEKEKLEPEYVRLANDGHFILDECSTINTSADYKKYISKDKTI